MIQQMQQPCGICNGVGKMYQTKKEREVLEIFVKKMAVTREVLDQKAGVKDCAECDGRGVQVRVVRMGPMIQQMQQPCGICNGVGKMYQTKKEREVLEIFVEKGAVDGHKITFSGKADEHPDADPGDVVFTLKQKEHPTFIR